jgi:hypothetical protein
MRKPPPIFGTCEIDYRLGPLFVKNHERYLSESQKYQELEKRWDAEKGVSLYKEMMESQHARFEAGVITLISGTSLMERVLYGFASSYMHFEAYESEYDRRSLEKKWIFPLFLLVAYNLAWLRHNPSNQLLGKVVLTLRN